MHVWPRERIHPAQRYPQPMQSSLADLLPAMDGAGVDHAVVSTTSLTTEEELLAMLEHSDRRLIPVLTVDPARAREETVAGADRFCGLRLVGDWGDEVGADLDSVVRIAAESDLTIQWTRRLADDSGKLVRAIADYGVAQVVDHLGLIDPFREDERAMLWRLADISRVYVKVSGLYALSAQDWPYRDLWPLLEESIAAFGVDRMLWGSDWPLSEESASYGNQLELLNLLPFVSANDREMILQHTPARLWAAR